jgi:hypothetical protein
MLPDKPYRLRGVVGHLLTDHARAYLHVLADVMAIALKLALKESERRRSEWFT